jgi:hypothetical protein
VKIEAALVKYVCFSPLYGDVRAYDFVQNSVYAEVRAVVSKEVYIFIEEPVADPTIPCLTIRTWFIGIIYVAVGVFLNQFFSIRQPSITVSANVAQMLYVPFLSSRITPVNGVSTGRFRWES